MNLTSHVDDTLNRWPRPVAEPPFTWWAAWMVRAAATAERLIRRAALRARARRAHARLARDVQHLDDRLLRDIGVEPARLHRLPVEWLALPPGLGSAGTDPDCLGRWHASDSEERRYASWLTATYGKLD